MLLALTTNQKLGLGLTAAVFIAFSLLAALVFPRGNPDFPGKRGLVPFIIVTVILMIAMLSAVEVFAKEEHHGEAAGETTETTTGTTETQHDADRDDADTDDADRDLTGGSAACRQAILRRGRPSSMPTAAGAATRFRLPGATGLSAPISTTR